MKRRPRDSFKQRAYDAEGKVFSGVKRTVDVPKFLDKMTATDVWKNAYPEVPSIRWYALRRNASALGIGGTIHGKPAIRMRRKAPLWLVCHEVAHVVTNAQDSHTQWHGVEWAGNYVALIHWFLGFDVAESLVLSFTREHHPFNVATDLELVK